MQQNLDVNIGIPKEARQKTSEGLAKVLADTYTLYLKTHNYHWNVTGPMFQTLHTMFEQQYTELAAAVDEVAERIRSLGFPAPGSYQAYAKLTSIKEEDGVPSAQDMIKNLLAGHETVARTAREAFPAAESGNDEATVDLLTQRIQTHEKTAWMLRSLLQS